MRHQQRQSRQRGRNSRNKGGNNTPNLNRNYDSAGPEGKVRGTPQQIVEKYNNLARDAATSGDRVLAENFLQHAEHYSRLIIAAQPPKREPDSVPNTEAAETSDSNTTEDKAQEESQNTSEALSVLDADNDQNEQVEMALTKEDDANQKPARKPRQPRKPKENPPAEEVPAPTDNVSAE